MWMTIVRWYWCLWIEIHEKPNFGSSYNGFRSHDLLRKDMMRRIFNFSVLLFTLHLLFADPYYIDSGIHLGNKLDFEGKKVPAGIAPDIGAYEYESAAKE